MSDQLRAALDGACDGLVEEVAGMIGASSVQRMALSYAEAEMRNRLASIDLAALRTSTDAAAVDSDVMIGNFIAQYDEGAAGCMMDVDDAQALAREFQRMRGLIYCPGVLRCAKCDLRLTKTTLTPTGAFANEEPDSCPNCNVPMWRTTWQDEAKDAYKTAESQMNRALDAERALAHPPVAAAAVAGDGEDYRQKLRMVISHASGGHLSDEADVERSINDICVQISRHHNRVWEAALEKGRKEVAHPPVAAAAVAGEDDILPCDVKLPPATTIGAGCSFDTLRLALGVKGRPRHFSEAIAIGRKLDAEDGGYPAPGKLIDNPINFDEFMGDEHGEAIEFVTRNFMAIRRDSGDMEYNLQQMIRCYEAGKASAAPAEPVGLREAVERFLADRDDGDRADAGTNPLMKAHIVDFRAALSTLTRTDEAGND